MSCNNPSGGKPPFCVDPHGGVILDASGRFAVMFAASGRPNFTGTGRAQQSAEEYKAAAMGHSSGHFEGDTPELPNGWVLL